MQGHFRKAERSRKTGETQVAVALNLDGAGRAKIETGVTFFDHMLTQVAVHGLIDLEIAASGDDAHHVIEDVMIALGEAFNAALGDRSGINRVGSAFVPMDDALARVVVDFSNRPYAVFDGEFETSMIADMPASLVRHVIESLAASARMNLHVKIFYGYDDHHKAEATFKALGRALRAAAERDPRREGRVPSSKGTLKA